MTEKDTGGSAFPSSSFVAKTALECIDSLQMDEYKKTVLIAKITKELNGMTLRDYFAAEAINECIKLHSDSVAVAEHAYRIADAMIKVRSAK